MRFSLSALAAVCSLIVSVPAYSEIQPTAPGTLVSVEDVIRNPYISGSLNQELDCFGSDYPKPIAKTETLNRMQSYSRPRNIFRDGLLIDLSDTAAIPDDAVEFRESIASVAGTYSRLQYQYDWYSLADTGEVDAVIYFRGTESFPDGPSGTTVASAVLRSPAIYNSLTVGVVERAAFPDGISEESSGLLVPYHELAVAGPAGTTVRFDLRNAFQDHRSSVIALAHGQLENGQYCVYVHRSTDDSPRNAGNMNEIHKLIFEVDSSSIELLSVGISLAGESQEVLSPDAGGVQDPDGIVREIWMLSSDSFVPIYSVPDRHVKPVVGISTADAVVVNVLHSYQNPDLPDTEAWVYIDHPWSYDGWMPLSELTGGVQARRILMLSQPLGIAHSIDEIIAFFGEPAEITDESGLIMGFHEVFRKKIYYRDAELDFTLSADRNKTVFDSFFLRGEKPALRFGLSVGSTQDEILNVLGEPDTKQQQWYYGVPEAYENSLVFSFSDNQVSAIRWHAFDF